MPISPNDAWRPAAVERKLVIAALAAAPQVSRSEVEGRLSLQIKYDAAPSKTSIAPLRSAAHTSMTVY
jgi:hypothetical protein